MKTAKSAVASAKESVANVAASANAGMDKTKATVQEKVERMSGHDPMQKDMATARKQEKIHQAESDKQEARENNAAARQAIAAGGAGTFTAIGRAQNSTPGAAGTQGTQNYAVGTQGSQNYAAGGDHGLNTHPTGGQNPDHLTGSNGLGYGTGQHAHNFGGVNTGGADAVYPDDPIGSGPNTIRNTSGDADHLTGSNGPEYDTGQHAHNLGGVNTGGADAVYPDDPIGSGPNTIRNTTGDADHLTGSNDPGQHAQNLGSVKTGGADVVYPDDPIGSGPNPIRNRSGGAPGTSQGTGGTY